MKIKQTKIIITGGSSGFGHLLSSYFSQNFYHVTILDIKKSKLKNVNFIRVDLSKKINQNILTKLNLKSAEKVVLINCAIWKSKKSISKENYNDLLKTFSVGLFSNFLLTREIAEFSIKNKIKCRIINIGSVLSKLVSTKQSASYHSLKSAIESMTRVFSINYISDYLTANTISLGFLKKTNLKTSLKLKKLIRNTKKLSKTKKIGDEKNLIECIKYLISDAGDYLNGANLVLDGGLSNIEQFDILEK